MLLSVRVVNDDVLEWWLIIMKKVKIIIFNIINIIGMEFGYVYI